MMREQYSQESINKMIGYVIEHIVNQTQCSISYATHMVENSSFFLTLSEDPDFVFHYDVEYWVKEIMDEYKA